MTSKVPSAKGPDPDAAAIKLTPHEEQWLMKLLNSFEQRLSLLADDPPKRTMNGLVKKGLAKDIMGTFWEISELGKQRCKTIF